MNKENGLAVFTMLLGVFLGAIFMGLLMEHFWETAAIEYECAQYNAKTGDFEWKRTKE